MAERRPNRNAQDISVAIVGAGPGGLACGYSLKTAGFHNFTIFERSTGVGGVWRQNTYPGAACDGKSHFYSFSWELNPNWSHAFAAQPEILGYFERAAEKHGLMPHLRPSTRIVRYEWSDQDQKWTIYSDKGESFRADVVISAVGLFNEPRYPDIPGLADFGGAMFHSAEWDHGHDFTGERVAVIGTGASAIQFVPEIVPKTERTYVFQRQPGWVLPKANPPYTPTQRRRFRRVPGRARLHRLHIWFVMERDVQIKIDSRIQRKQRRMALAHLRRAVSDPELRAALTPDYPVGCTRRLLSNDWFPTLQADNAEVVTARISRFTKDGIETSDGKFREVDAVCLATGFKRGYLSTIEVIGSGGRRLTDDWAHGARAHFGLTIPHFPNLFLIYGPYTNGVTPITHVIEAQARYITLLLKRMRRRKLSVVDVKQAALERYDERIQKALVGSVWAGGCGSYFLDAEGKVRTQFPHRFVRYWLMTWRIRVRDYRWALSSFSLHRRVNVPKHALVTGASRGIGRAIAQRLAEEGYDLTISARKADVLEEAAEQLRARGGHVLAIPADMADEEQVVALASAFRERHNTLDVLVVAAGIGSAGPMDGYSVARLDNQLAVNLRGPFILIQNLLPALRAAAAAPGDAARIIAIASITGVVGHADLGAYGATKAALMSLCESITAAESMNGVSATALAPGYVATDMTAWIQHRVAPGEMIQAGDIAELAVSLCRLSRQAVVPSIVVTRPGKRLWRA